MEFIMLGEHLAHTNARCDLFVRDKKTTKSREQQIKFVRYYSALKYDTGSSMSAVPEVFSLGKWKQSAVNSITTKIMAEVAFNPSVIQAVARIGQPAWERLFNSNTVTDLMTFNLDLLNLIHII